MSLQKRIETMELTVKCFEFILNIPSNATTEFIEWQRRGLARYKSELEHLKELLRSDEEDDY